MARPIEIYYVIEDGDGKRSRLSVFAASDLALSEMAPTVDAIAQNIIPIIGGAIVDAGYTVPQDLSASTWYVDMNNSVNPNSDIEEGALFVFESIEGYKKSLRLPTFEEAYITPGTDEVNQEAPNVDAFLDMFRFGVDNTGESGTLAAAPLVTAHDEALVMVRSAKESFLKTRR